MPEEIPDFDFTQIDPEKARDFVSEEISRRPIWGAGEAQPTQTSQATSQDKPLSVKELARLAGQFADPPPYPVEIYCHEDDYRFLTGLFGSLIMNEPPLVPAVREVQIMVRNVMRVGRPGVKFSDGSYGVFDLVGDHENNH